MCGLCRHMKREGVITFNGQPATKRLKRIIGFVMQVLRTCLPSPAPRDGCSDRIAALQSGVHACMHVHAAAMT